MEKFKPMSTKFLAVMRSAMLLSLICLFPALADYAYAQTTGQGVRVTGTVSDNFGTPIPGVSVVISGSTVGIATDTNGEFTIAVPNGEAVIQFSFPGYEPQDVTVGNRRVLAITMKEAATEIDKVVVVAFGTQKKESVVSSITSVRPSELKVPSSNLTTALAGKVAGIISYQSSGEPGQDNANFFVRGVTTFGYAASPLILIDGVEMSSNDLAHLQVDDIASFSIMKDATAAALYGARGANGVILVTTKEGKEGAAKISVRYESSFSTPTKTAEFADPITYMRLSNEAVTTRDPMGRQLYSSQKIDKTIAGTNPYVYPAVDWYKMLFKDYAVNHRVNFNVNGGGTVARYYIAATYSKDSGVLNVNGKNNYNNNIDLSRYQIHSNININLTRTTEAIIRVHSTFNDYRGPLDGGNELYQKVMRSNPVLFPAYYEPDDAHANTEHILFGNYDTGNYTNPYADMVRGYKDYNEATVSAQFELKQDLGFILEGLKARAMHNETRYSYSEVLRAYNPYYYSVGSYDKYSDTYKLIELNPTGGTDYLDYTEPAGGKRVESTIYSEAAISYDRTFAEKHTVSAMLVGTMRNRIISNAGTLQKSLPYRNMGLSGRATYSFDSRYFFEANFGYNGSERFDKGHRFGFFPSVGLGYIVSSEKFYGTGLKKIMPTLKFKATHGLVGNDNIANNDNRFFFLSEVNMNAGSTYAFGYDFNYTKDKILITRYANSDITWEVSRKTNFGVEMNLLNAIDINAEVFFERRSNILLDRADIPQTMGLTGGVLTPKANLGVAKAHGVDFSIDYHKSFNRNWWMTGRVNFTYSTAEYVTYEEANYDDTPWLSHVGQKLNQTWGYVAERLFVDEYDVQNSPEQAFGSKVLAGDIKYRDINGDGIISTWDRVPLGYPTVPEIVYGFGVSTGWKSFDFSCFFQGTARRSFWMRTTTSGSNYSTMPFQNQTQLLKAYADDYWSEYNRNLYALFPRLDSEENLNNRQTSTWWMRNGSFLRLKSVEVGYTLPERLTEKIRLKGIRVYASGTNLLTFSKFKLWDPEMAGNGLGYPIQKVINAGIQVSF